jgi:hypothetical protein
MTTIFTRGRLTVETVDGEFRFGLLGENDRFTQDETQALLVALAGALAAMAVGKPVEAPKPPEPEKPVVDDESHRALGRLTMRLFGVANGLTNYTSERSEVRRLERELEELEAEFRAMTAARAAGKVAKAESDDDVMRDISDRYHRDRDAMKREMERERVKRQWDDLRKGSDKRERDRFLQNQIMNNPLGGTLGSGLGNAAPLTYQQARSIGNATANEVEQKRSQGLQLLEELIRSNAVGNPVFGAMAELMKGGAL